MATNNVRATFLFQSGRIVWSETHWTLAGTNLDDAVDKARDIAKLRAKLLGGGAFLQKVRVSNDAINGDSKQAIVGYVGVADPDVNSLADEAFNSLLLRANGSIGNPDQGLYHKAIYLSGAPIYVAVFPKLAQFPPLYFQRFLAWKNALCNGQWGFVAFNKEPGAAPAKPIVAWAPQGVTTVLTVPGHGFAVGARIRITGNRSLPGPSPRGVYTTLAGTAGDTVIIDAVFPNPEEYLALGTARLVSQSFIPYSDIGWVGLSRHKRGGGTDISKARTKRAKV